MEKVGLFIRFSSRSRIHKAETFSFTRTILQFIFVTGENSLIFSTEFPPPATVEESKRKGQVNILRFTDHETLIVTSNLEFPSIDVIITNRR